MQAAIEAIQEVIEHGFPETGSTPEETFILWTYDFWPSVMPWLPSQVGPAVDQLLKEASDLIDRFQQVTGFDLRADLLTEKYTAENMDDEEQEYLASLDVDFDSGDPF
jgi:hypothetical protein